MNVCISALALSLLAAPSKPEQFAPNHLFVGGLNSLHLHEFDSGGTELQTIGSGFHAEGIAFGPNGHLYVSSFSQDLVLELDATGAMVGEIGAGSGLDGPLHLAFGPNGDLFVGSSIGDEVIEFDAAGEVVRTIGGSGELNQPMGIGFGPDGNLYVVSLWTDRVVVFDAAGTKLKEIGSSATFAAPAALAFAPNGHLFVADAIGDRVHEFDSTGEKLGEIGLGSGLDSPGGMAFGPNGHLYVASAASDRVLEFDHAGAKVNEIGAGSGLDGPIGIAFAPFRFKAKVAGSLARSGLPIDAVSEGAAMLSIAPGSGTLMLDLGDHAAPGDLSSALSATALVFHGLTVLADDDAKQRLVHGATIRVDAGELSPGSLELRTKGKVGADGCYRVDSAKGSLHLAAAGCAALLTVRTTKPE